MPLISFIKMPLPPTDAALRSADLFPGDVVGHIVEIDVRGTVTPKQIAHVGIIVNPESTHNVTLEVQVVHMANFVELSYWKWGYPSSGESVINVRGTMPALDSPTRSSIVDYAMSVSHKIPSMEAYNSERGYYWMGSASLSSHPCFPDDNDGYGLTCATFVQECYRASLPVEKGSIVDDGALPLTSDSELGYLRHVFKDKAEKKPFRRLNSCFLLAAFLEDRYPFSTPDWAPYSSPLSLLRLIS